MKAAFYYGEGDIRVEDIKPDELGSNDVRIETSACGICGTDLHEYVTGPIYTPAEPHPLTGASLPVRLGHEFGGTVTETGDDVTDLEVGDTVAVNPMLACNECRYCQEGKGNLCEKSGALGLSAHVGGFSESVVVVFLVY
jgi:(R,R)-butanediol dehydrogenase/meso-butanediol dehydrogenase/diacetyl reductase